VCKQEGDDLISKQHYASEDIREKNALLQQRWEMLLNASNEKKRRLVEALQVCILIGWVD
jgi:hypothetical protein